MEIAPWSEKYMLNVPEVDGQHQRWFALVHAFAWKA